MTKKEFKELVNTTVYTGGGRKINAMFFHWDNGYKYMVYADIKCINKKDLFNIFYSWVYNGLVPPYTTQYKFAETDDKRFKIPLSLK